MLINNNFFSFLPLPLRIDRAGLYLFQTEQTNWLMVAKFYEVLHVC